MSTEKSMEEVGRMRRWLDALGKRISGWPFRKSWHELEQRLDGHRKANASLVVDIGTHAKYEDSLRATIEMLEARVSEQDRMLMQANSGGNGLSPAEIERVAILAEECGAVVQICGKILRFGFESCSPYDDKCRPNRVLLERELGGLRAVIDLAVGAGDIRAADIHGWRQRKRRGLHQWTKHQEGSEQRLAAAAEKAEEHDGAARS